MVFKITDNFRGFYVLFPWGQRRSEIDGDHYPGAYSAGVLDKAAGVPVWVKLICAVAMALGTSVGGWKIIKTMGVSMIRLQPIGGFAAETGAALVIQLMTLFGAPVSTTHVISSSIMGVGASKRLSAVRWALARNIVVTWVITIPATMILGALITLVFKAIIGG